MPIQIGAKTDHSFKNPIGLLTDCHRRIKKFLMMMITVMRQTHGGPLKTSQQEALELALQYFREAAPKHALDEEASLFPRMRPLCRMLDSSIKSLNHLEKEHHIADENHRTVEQLSKKWLLEGQLCFEDACELSDALGRLSVLYKKHIDVEERKIFPLASRILSAAEVTEIGREMAMRRNINPEILANLP
ncbi:hemerythrin domain-containing protein [bacterium]|nr:hemerythrin domain-containing protein [bacterium]